ncbi:hypothetical protein ZWY2020_054705, partial [Hordeum vulgare]
PPLPVTSGTAQHAPELPLVGASSRSARFFAPVLYLPLATPPPWLGFRAGLRRHVSGGPIIWRFEFRHHCSCSVYQGPVLPFCHAVLLRGIWC